MRRSDLSAGALLLGLGLCFAWFPFALAAKYCVDIIALGYSLAKTLLFLAFLATLALCHGRLGKNLSPRLPRIFAVALLAMSALSLGQYLWYCSKFQLQPTYWTAMVRDGLWSMSRLDHFHTSKAMLSSLPVALALKTDVGYAFGAVFPQWLLLAQLALFLGLIGLCFGSCLQILAEKPWGQSISFVLASFVLVKCVVDGGPLIAEVWAALPFFSYALWGRRAALLAAGCCALYAGSLFAWKPGAVSVCAALLVSILALATPLVMKRSPAAGLALLLLVLSLPLLRWKLDPQYLREPYALNTMVYGQQPLQAGWTLHFVSSERFNGQGLVKIVEQTEDPASRRFLTDAELLRDSTPKELCAQLGLELPRKPVSWYHGPVRVEAEVLYFDSQTIPTLKSPLLSAASISQNGESTTLTLDLKPGVNRDLAIGMLGPHLSLVKSFTLSYPEPER